MKAPYSFYIAGTALTVLFFNLVPAQAQDSSERMTPNGAVTHCKVVTTNGEYGVFGTVNAEHCQKVGRNCSGMLGGSWVESTYFSNLVLIPGSRTCSAPR